MERIVIAGAGQAGLQACVTLRQAGFDGGIVLIGDEPHAPYQRPPLSKKFLAGEIDAERLHLKPEAFFTEAAIDLRLGVAVEAIDRDTQRVHLSTGERPAYDRLLIATGTQARMIPISGHTLPGVLTLRTVGHVTTFRPYLGTGRRAVIIGGGYIGLEVAAVCRSLGLDVMVFEAEDRVMQRVVSPDVSAFYERLHRDHHVSLQTSTAIAEITGRDHCSGVITADGTHHDADLVLIAVGAVPNTALAEGAGLDVDNGIVVDRSCQTSDAAIYAAGDCTNFPSRLYGRQIRLESVQNAIDQAKAAAGAMLGREIAYDPVPWFWSDQYDVKLQIAGLSQGYDVAETRGDPGSGAFAVIYGKGGTLIAVDAINQPRAHMLARRAIGQPLNAFDWQP